MEKYLYFRADSTIGNDDDATNGSRLYPVSKFKGACMGTAANTGIVTGDDDAFSLFFEPMAVKAGIKGEDDTAGASGGDGAEVDVVVVAITTDNNAKVVMEAFVNKINSPTIAGSPAFINVFDAVTGDKLHTDIEGITVLHSDMND